MKIKEKQTKQTKINYNLEKKKRKKSMGMPATKS